MLIQYFAFLQNSSTNIAKRFRFVGKKDATILQVDMNHHITIKMYLK